MEKKLYYTKQQIDLSIFQISVEQQQLAMENSTIFIMSFYTVFHYHL
jgi:hypothetical protein